MERFEQALQARADTEGRDPQWTDAVQGAFLEKMATLEGAPVFESAHCGSSLCTVVVSHEDDGAHANLVAAMHGNTQSLAGQFLVRRHPNPAGGYRTTFYFSKPGEGVPDLRAALSG